MTSAVYDTDLTDAQWAIIAHLIPRPRRIGRPRTINPRHVLNAIFYIIKSGCHWRLLPKEYPHWRTCFGYFKEWGRTGKLRYIQKVLLKKVRVAAGRHHVPTIAILDSQTVKTSKMSPVSNRGFDGNKRVKGRKRHLVVDSLGFPMGIKITTANVSDKAVSYAVLKLASNFIDGRGFDKVYADGGYVSKELEKQCWDEFNAKLIISENPAKAAKQFIPVTQRWVVERTFAWLYDCRRLVVDHERKITHSKFMIRLAAIRLMLRRLSG